MIPIPVVIVEMHHIGRLYFGVSGYLPFFILPKLFCDRKDYGTVLQIYLFHWTIIIFILGHSK